MKQFFFHINMCYNPFFFVVLRGISQLEAHSYVSWGGGPQPVGAGGGSALGYSIEPLLGGPILELGGPSGPSRKGVGGVSALYGAGAPPCLHHLRVSPVLQHPHGSLVHGSQHRIIGS